MNKPTTWMKSQPIASFFVLTLAMMYVIGFHVVNLMGVIGSSTDRPLLNLLIAYAGELAVYSPVLVGLFVTQRILPDRSSSSAWKRRLTFWIVWLVGLFVYALDLKLGPSGKFLGWIPLLIISMPVALLPAFVVSRAFSRVTGLGLLFQGSMLFVALIVFLLLQPLLTTATLALTDVIVIFMMGQIFFVPFVLFLRGAARTETPTG